MASTTASITVSMNAPITEPTSRLVMVQISALVMELTSVIIIAPTQSFIAESVPASVTTLFPTHGPSKVGPSTFMAPENHLKGGE